MKKYLILILMALMLSPCFATTYDAELEERYESYYENGVTFFNSNQYASAIQQFKKVLRFKPYDKKAKNALITAYIARANFYANQNSQPLKAIIDLKSALFYLKYWNADNSAPEAINQATTTTKALSQLEADTKRIQNSAQRFDNARILRIQGELAASGYDFAQLFNDKTYSTRAYENAGDIYKTLNNEYDALNSYREVLRAEPKNASVHFKYALILDSANNFEAAGEQYNLALKYGEKNPELLDKLEQLWLNRSLNNPNDPQALINLGTVLQKKGDLVNAQVQYKKALEIDPNDETVRVNLASLYVEGNNLNEAIKIYNEMLAKNPNDIKALSYKAAAYEKLKDYKNAIQTYKQILGIDSANKLAKEAIGDIVANNLTGEELNRYLLEQAKANPTDYNSQYEYAYQMHKVGNLDEALKYYQNALKINDKSLDCCVNISQIYLSKNDMTNAKKYVEEGLLIAPKDKNLLSFKDDIVKSDSIELYNKATKLYDSKKYKEALELYSQIPIETLELNEAIASCYLELEDYKNAIVYFNKNLSKNPKDIPSLYSIASCYLELEDGEQAKIYLNKMLEIEPDNEAAKTALLNLEQANLGTYLNDALAFYEKKDYFKAMTTLDKIISIDPKNAYAFYYKGVIYDEQNKLNEAIAQFKKVIEFDPQFSSAYYSLGSTFDKQEKYEEAVKNYDKFLELKKKAKEADDEYYKYVDVRNKELKDYLKSAK